MTQLPLPGAERTDASRLRAVWEVLGPAVNGHERDARIFLAARPEVWTLFLVFAEPMRRLGRRFGIGLLAERVRWEVRTTWTPEARGYRLNNNHRAYLARYPVAVDPRLGPLLTTRRVAGVD
jgi:hypothetical protein